MNTKEYASEFFNGVDSNNYAKCDYNNLLQTLFNEFKSNIRTHREVNKKLSLSNFSHYETSTLQKFDSIINRVAGIVPDDVRQKLEERIFFYKIAIFKRLNAIYQELSNSKTIDIYEFLGVRERRGYINEWNLSFFSSSDIEDYYYQVRKELERINEKIGAPTDQKEIAMYILSNRLYEQANKAFDEHRRERESENNQNETFNDWIKFLLGLYDSKPQLPVKSFSILGVKSNATMGECKKAYRLLALELHPDKHINSSTSVIEKFTERFREVVEAYSNVKDYFKSIK